ncbi:16S rRNA (uracil(1498)-N(3))-methyltransferase [Bacteroidales bacterium OttesenSCG-928-C19]|nr:16S rRNA (uracil(1498)-N(3))-methyltransferase [Bacteroidales bacterium OttesenSCG-928-C19]
MQLFYIPEVLSEIVSLSEEESQHCKKVLRLREGSPLSLTDGKGNLYKGEIIDTSGKQCDVQIKETIAEFGKRNFYLHVAIAPTKNIDRLEWFLEKSVEMGVDEITPILCEHSERTVVKSERLQKIIVSAMKQSLKAYLPKLNELTPLNKFIQQPFSGKKMIAYCNDDHRNHISEVCQKKENALILIGPEGDFSEKEIQLALSNNYLPVSLGESRLRTETAGVASVFFVNFINQMKRA